ncbi:BglG family transcriptional antiterminator [Breznakia blatticola]|uniref:BglG family transcriptional antiterminator n=1 Tax=Breznakia blatticola TaxID=1754012 RepID=A0A4V3G689_9FIRM|nr:BglG family transcription antiterminator [Breznakia blatticola]TDW09366.1 BglG family transcriptional antiterminator [Breznakia blatticola]
MLSNRQFKIMQQLANTNEYISSAALSELFKVSSRSIKNDMQTIRLFLESNYPNTHIQSVPSKGYIVIYDSKAEQDAFINICNDLQTLSHYEDEQLLRVKKIILLLFDHTYITKWKIIDRLYISESTFYSDLKEVEAVLSKYDLHVEQKKQFGYYIVGLEKDMRLCLIKENLYTLEEHEINQDRTVNIQNIARISEILSNILLENEYRTSDTLLENLVVHILITLSRIRSGNMIMEPSNYPDIKQLKEYAIAKQILEAFIVSSEHLQAAHLENEIIHLTTNLLGKSEYNKNTLISKETNEFIQYTLECILEKFAVDFTNDVDLKISLSMHLVPLLHRIRYGMQQKSKMAREIKVSFPLATDIASYFAHLLQNHYDLVVSDDEITFLSLYFNYSLDNLKVGEDAKNILIITTLRQSETILIRQKFMHWFKNQIQNLVFIRPNEAVEHLMDFDAIFTTDDFDDDAYSGAVVKINLFPNDEDYIRINHALYGFTSANAVLSKFRNELVYIGKAKSKDEVLQKLFHLAEKTFHLDDSFRQSVMDRESVGNTYYGSKISMPHPLAPTTDETFVAMALLENEIEWGENQNVQIIFMVSTEKNNPRAFQFWHYLSLFVSNDTYVKQLLENLTYQNFMRLLNEAIASEFK